MKRLCVDCNYYDNGVCDMGENGTEYDDPSCDLGNAILGMAQPECKWGCNISEESFQKKSDKETARQCDELLYWEIQGNKESYIGDVIGKIIKAIRANEYADGASVFNILYESGVRLDLEPNKMKEIEEKVMENGNAKT